MAEIKVGKNETLDSALRRFKRATQKAGILSEVRKTRASLRQQKSVPTAVEEN